MESYKQRLTLPFSFVFCVRNLTKCKMQPSPGEQASLLSWVSSLWPSHPAGLRSCASQADFFFPLYQAVVFDVVALGTPQQAVLVGAGASVISSFLMPENDLKQHLPINQKTFP